MISPMIEDEDDNDCVFVDETYREKFFFPVDKSWQASKCEQFNLPLKVELTVHLQQPVPAFAPKRLKNVKGDGNCFYRCISYYITGEEYYHALIRQHLVLFMDDHPELVGRLADNDDYTCESKNWVDGKWPTEVEIYLSACMLKTDIFTYKDNIWLLFGAQGRLEMKDTHERAIYLLNSGNHYQVVLGVEEPQEKNHPPSPIPTSYLRLGQLPTATTEAEEPREKNDHPPHSVLTSHLTMDQQPAATDGVEEHHEMVRSPRSTLRSYLTLGQQPAVTTEMEELLEKNDHPPHSDLTSHLTLGQQPAATDGVEEHQEKIVPFPSSILRTYLTLGRLPTATDVLEKPQEKKYNPPNSILTSYFTLGQQPTDIDEVRELEEATDGVEEHQEEMVHSPSSIHRSHLTLGQLPPATDILEEPQEKNGYPPNSILKSDLILGQQPTATDRVREPWEKHDAPLSSILRLYLTTGQRPAYVVEQVQRSTKHPPSPIQRSY